MGVGEVEGDGCRGVVSDASAPTALLPFFERGITEGGREGGSTSPA